MSKELKLLLPLINNRTSETVGDITYHIGTIGPHEIIATESGIGKVNAALAAQSLINTFRPALVINTGVAGGVGRSRVLEVVVPRAVAYHDVWCGPGTVWGQAADCPREFQCSFGPGNDIPTDGLLASGDIFISKPEEVKHILSVYPQTVAVDMESAAIAQACYKSAIDFACIRVISDTPGADDNIAQYQSFWDDAPQATFAALTSILRRLA